MIHGYRAVAVCVAEMQNEDIQEMLLPLQHYLQERDWKTLIFNSTTDMQQDTEFDHGERCVFGLIPYDRIDAVLIYGRTIKQNSVIQEIVDKAYDHNKPVVIIDCDTSFEGAINIVYEEEQAFTQLVTHMVRDHHFKKINFVAGIKDNVVSDRRLNIFRDIMDKYGLKFDEERQLGYGMFYDYPTVAVTEKFLADPDGLPEAIICANDTMAIAVCDTLLEHGVRVPDDVAVTGFDGIIREKYASPRLTTCRRNMKHMAEFIGNIIIDNAGSRIEEGDIVNFPLWFHTSESCGCSKHTFGDNHREISRLCSQTYDNAYYDRQMTYMLTKMNMTQTKAEMQSLLNQYMEQDTIICVNSEMDTDNVGYHWFNMNPFSREMKLYRYFNDFEIESFITPVSELLYDWDLVFSFNLPIVFMALHNHADCCGFLAILLDNSDYPDFLRAAEHSVRLAVTLDSIISLHVQQDIMRRTNNKLKHVQDTIIASFADLVESRDDSTGQHIKRTQEYIAILVEKAAEREKYASTLTPRVRELITKAAPLHDIGKITVSDTILNKKGKLTEEEFDEMRKHCVEGGKIIDSTLTGIEEPEYLEIARNVSVFHHEKWNGKGYPYGLSGEEIPLCARMMAIVDVFDALSSKRVYKDAYSLDETFRIMEESRGNHFDPELTDIFFEVKEEIIGCYLANAGTDTYQGRVV